MAHLETLQAPRLRRLKNYITSTHAEKRMPAQLSGFANDDEFLKTKLVKVCDIMQMLYSRVDRL